MTIRLFDRWSFLRTLSPGWWMAATVLVVTTVLFGLALPHFTDSRPLWPWPAPSLLLSNWAIALLAVILLATARSRYIEPMFGGLDRAVRLHRHLAPIAIALTLIHVVLYLPSAIAVDKPIADLLIPFWSASATESFNALVLWALLVWTGLAYSKRLRYERWLSLHGLLGPIFVATSVHALPHGPMIQAYEPLRFWMWFLVLAGAAAWVYRVVAYRWMAPRYLYRVESVATLPGDTVDLVMRPETRRMMYDPGTFVFIRLPEAETGDVARQYHPFSIASSPADRDLRLSIRMVGDFTKSLPALPRRTPVEVFGPFGGFTPNRLAPYRRLVCIGAGIGISPFLSVIRFEFTNNDFRRTWLWYVVREAERAPYDEELKAAVPKADSYIDYTLWATGERGRLTARQVMEEVEPLTDYAVMLCGPPAFIRDMVRQFKAAGFPSDRLIFEDLHFH
jgi:predicted ferric reductase